MMEWWRSISDPDQADIPGLKALIDQDRAQNPLDP